LGGM
jgi:hypothetical protein